METGQSRNRILVVDDEPAWLMNIRKEAMRISPEIEIREESTREGALAAISQEADRLIAVITDNHLLGVGGAYGEEIARHAQEAGIPHIAILTARPDTVKPSEGIEVWDKTDQVRKQLARILST